jgi:inner membrane protein
MKNSFYFKLGTIFILILALLIPKSVLTDLINERISWRQQAYDSIRQSWPGEQTLAGPVLVVPYQVTYLSKETVNSGDKKTGKTKIITKESTYSDTAYLLSSQLNIESQLTSSLRYRGIYGIPVYNSNLSVKGEFNFQPLRELAELNKDRKLVWGKPYLSVLIRDQRGIATPPSLIWGDSTLAFLPGSQLAGSEAGMYAKIPDFKFMQNTRLNFAFNIVLKGMQSINYSLLSDDTSIKLASNWASPSFTGEMLPDKREITPQGFSAEWRASSFSHNTANALDACRHGECARLMDKAVGFDLIQPVDVYQQSDRSIKYAFLFITLTFVVLILLEVMKKLPIHPIQYSLVGMALLMFYLLLISLSEHIAFALAYGSGAAASTLLLTVYFGAILHNPKLGVMLGTGLSVLYSLLFVILQAEDTALLMGSVLIFLILALLMLLTRKLDWYALTQTNNPETQGQQ